MAEKLLAATDAGRPASRSRTAMAALSGLLVAWLHPWQALMLLGILGCMLVAKPPRRRYVALTIPAIATFLPLVYGFVLSRSDASWAAFQQLLTTAPGTAPLWALVASFGPLVAFAAFGLRRSREDGEWMLALWLMTCTVVYLAVPEFPPYALSGVTLPLAVLAVRGWEHIRLRAHASVRLAAPAAAAAILAVTVPVAVYDAQGVANDFSNSIGGVLERQPLVLSPNQAAALGYLGQSKRPGGVLTPWYLSMSVPGFTGRSAYAGHQNWQPNTHVAIDASFFSPTLNDPTGAFRRRILRETQAKFVLADCGAPIRLAADIAPIARPIGRFGCVTVYERR
jgi:hypothetical protein